MHYHERVSKRINVLCPCIITSISNDHLSQERWSIFGWFASETSFSILIKLASISRHVASYFSPFENYEKILWPQPVGYRLLWFARFSFYFKRFTHICPFRINERRFDLSSSDHQKDGRSFFKSEENRFKDRSRVGSVCERPAQLVITSLEYMSTRDWYYSAQDRTQGNVSRRGHTWTKRTRVELVVRHRRAISLVHDEKVTPGSSGMCVKTRPARVFCLDSFARVCVCMHISGGVARLREPARSSFHG